MTTAKKSSNSGGQKSRNGRISKTLMESCSSNIVIPQTLFPVVFHAKISPLLENKSELQDSVQDFGRKCSESFAKFDLATSLWRTYQLSFQMEWELFSETWPKSGTMQNGNVFQRVPLERLIPVRESGLLPTPTASDMTCGETIGKEDNFYYTKTGMPRKVNKSGKNGSVGLGRLVKMWPTPMAESSSKIDSPGERERDSPHLETIVKEIYGIPVNKKVRLHPHFLEWLMGLPQEWTGEQCLATAKSFKSSSTSEKE